MEEWDECAVALSPFIVVGPPPFILPPASRREEGFDFSDPVDDQWE